MEEVKLDSPKVIIELKVVPAVKEIITAPAQDKFKMQKTGRPFKGAIKCQEGLEDNV